MSSDSQVLGSIPAVPFAGGTRMNRFSTRVKGAPSKLLDELIATPAIKKRRGGSAGRPPKKAKIEGIDRLYAYQQNEQQRRQFQLMQQMNPNNPMLRMFAPGIVPGFNPSVLGGYPAITAAAAALTPGGAPGPATFRPGTAAASHVHQTAFPAVPVAPHAMAGHDMEDYMEDGAEDAARSSGELVTLLAASRCSALTPASFFVAWHGVLTLSFSGFTSSLTALKTELSALESAWALPIEQSGSKWPKLTLACLRDGRMLTIEQLKALYLITAKFREKVRADPWRMAVRELSYVKFASRSCERLLLRTDVPLKDSLAGRAAAAAAQAAAAATGKPGALSQGLPVDVPAEEAGKVQMVLNELTDVPGSCENYLQHVNKPGGRVSHYQGAHSESSLVAFACPSKQHQAAMSRPPSFLDEFKSEVDALLPEYYEWFPWQSLHCTIRTMA